MLRSKEFEYGGVAGLSLSFYPQGRGRDDSAEVVLIAANGLELMVKCKFTAEFPDQSKGVVTTNYLKHFPDAFFKPSPAYRSITVELVSVKKKCQEQDTQQINVVPDDMLRVTWDTQTAGAEHCVVELRHANDKLVAWGKGALSKLLTSDEVEGMTVNAYGVFLFSLSCV